MDCSSYNFPLHFIAINNETMMTSSFVTNLDDLINERFDKLAKYRAKERGDDLYWTKGFLLGRWTFYLNRETLALRYGKNDTNNRTKCSLVDLNHIKNRIDKEAAYQEEKKLRRKL